jgi:hypothetical protein
MHHGLQTRGDARELRVCSAEERTREIGKLSEPHGRDFPVWYTQSATQRSRQMGLSRTDAKEEGAATPVDDRRLQASARLHLSPLLSTCIHAGT